MSNQTVRLLVGLEQSCGYLNGQKSRSAFVAPSTQVDGDLYNLLIANGFRRSGNYAYRPACLQCRSCIPVRIPVAQFVSDRSQRRAYKKNADLRLSVDAHLGAEQFELYRRYLLARHPNGGMDPNDIDSFHQFLGSGWGITEFWSWHDEQQLVMVAVVDRLDNGLSAVYTFYDPELSRQRSLGTYAVLCQIEHALERGLDHVYLGYWVAQSPTMHYKCHFQALEFFNGTHWQLLPKPVSS